MHERYRLRWQFLAVFAFIYSQGLALKCYVGSKGVSNNGKEVHSFLPNECEEEMTHCFESYTDDMSQITASCQSLNTEQRLLDVCKEGCRNHTDLNVTICCCDSDLCNLPPEEKKKATEQTETTEDVKGESIEEDDRNSTVHGGEEELLPITLEELLTHPKLIPSPHAL
uniref:Activin_recp domain-containing protein n=1 Tax=Haemonchus contortus TaxID=6289 RepID=A0A7I4YK61_HAECO|nr:Hypothetical protein CBG04431 [Haemonchus contortus]